MSTKDTKAKITSFNWYRVLFVPAFVVLAIELMRPLTPVFNSLPDEYGGTARLIAAFVGMIGIYIKDDKNAFIKKIIVPALAALGLVILLETGVTYLLDAALILMLSVSAGLELTAFSSFAVTACTLGATFICSYKGFIRDYSFNGINAFGFRSLTGFFLVLALLIVSLITVIYLYIKNKAIRKSVSYLAYASALSGIIVLAILKALNLAAAVDPGSYQIFGGSSVMGIEARMKGFEDIKVGFGNVAPTKFYIAPDGDHYLITMDSYGVTKTLCILDGELMAGNFEQSEPAHLWDIEAVAGTPYFTIVNVETGLGIIMDENGNLELIPESTEDERSLMRIGDENLDYYESINTYESNDLGRAFVTADSGLAYTGSAVVPGDVTVELDGNVLTEGSDYELSYFDNFIPGTAHVVVTGIGEYEGSTGTSFEIIYDDYGLDDDFNRNTSDYIVRMYRMAFMRLPSIDEIRSWSMELTGGNRTPDSVIWEAYQNGGLSHSNSSFVEAIYRLMLLRNGSRGELRNWINELDNGATREDVIGEISASPDYQNIWHNFGIGYR